VKELGSGPDCPSQGLTLRQFSYRLRKAGVRQAPHQATMKTIDEMLHLALLTPDEHRPISHWIAQADSPTRS
jgi:hypothetical protein